ncbi:UNVERIFIED_CONTAM: hypothetical protein K2H54_017020 [Gekko kuhli]
MHKYQLWGTYTTICFSCLVEGDVKEEILQPPEPHPVPPILTPSPPSAYPTVTTVWQDNDRYHPKPVLHIVSSKQPADLNENYCKGTDNSGKNELSECVEKKLERNLSFEIKKVPLQEGPRSFDGNSLLNRGHAIKIKSGSSCTLGKTFKPQEQGSRDASVDTSQNSCLEGNMQPPNMAVISSLEGHQCLIGSDAVQRPDCLPLKEKGHARWSLQGAENVQPKSTSEDSQSAVSCPGVKNMSVVPNSPSHMDPSSSEMQNLHPTTVVSVRTPLCFTNPLHSDDSDTDERNSGGARSQSMSNISTASATVSVAVSTENISVRKVLPMSIARQDAVITTHSSTNKDAGPSEDSSCFPERTPESLARPSEQTIILLQAAEWSSLQDQKTSEQTQCTRPMLATWSASSTPAKKKKKDKPEKGHKTSSKGSKKSLKESVKEVNPPVSYPVLIDCPPSLSASGPNDIIPP